MTLAVAERTRPPETIPDLWLPFAPVKRAPVEWLVEKATELGVARLVPVTTARTVVERLRIDRLQSIAIESAERCGRTILPAIAEPVALDAFLRANDRALYFADETGGEAAGTAFAAGPAMILIGPEGGFTPGERSAIPQPVPKPSRSGPRILRADNRRCWPVATRIRMPGHGADGNSLYPTIRSPRRSRGTCYRLRSTQRFLCCNADSANGAFE